MFNAKLPHMLCAKCGAKVARDAYYCKSCGEVIEETLAPGAKIEDRRFMSRLKFALEHHLIRNIVIGIFIIFFAAAAVRVSITNLDANRDNGSSNIFQLTVLESQDPMTCRGAVCHIVINIKNKTGVVRILNGIPDLVTSAGGRFGPADPNRMGNGESYCKPKISITLQPHEFARDIGICSQDIPVGTEMVLAELRNPSGGLIVSGVFKATAY